ncbi:MAG: 4Fe-4S dicluster domain-containing protein [Deltaproteobacteria bacterium]|nr:4Fe-4S dicluster domain-containing protein [Deltaproteobacteria bacterium]
MNWSEENASAGEEHVRNTRKNSLKTMEHEAEGYRIDACSSSRGCPNRIHPENVLIQELEKKLSARDLKTFLKTYINGPVRKHHEFRVSVSNCPNACSRPQIVKFGLIGACRPMVSEEPCTQCQSCVDACDERAVSFTEEFETPIIDMEKCLACGKCIKVCPTGTLAEEVRGYRVLVDGKLGRHPRLARELEGIFSAEEVLALVDRHLDFFQMNYLVSVQK